VCRVALLSLYTKCVTGSTFARLALPPRLLDASVVAFLETLELGRCASSIISKAEAPNPHSSYVVHNDSDIVQEGWALVGAEQLAVVICFFVRFDADLRESVCPHPWLLAKITRLRACIEASG